MSKSDSILRGVVVKLIFINVIIYILQNIEQTSFVTYLFALRPNAVLNGQVWQLFTYMFLHDPSSPAHLFFNMYSLFIFGLTIENEWGSRKTLFYYLFCGVGAGITIFVINLIVYGTGFGGITIGASGAIFGLFLAFGVLFPNAEVLLFFIIPMKARTMVIIFGALELFFEVTGFMGNVSHVGHIGGLFFGIIYFTLIDRWRSYKRKVRSFVEKIEKPVTGESSPIRNLVIRDENIEMKKKILKKLEEEGSGSINDDEYQFMKYLDIMTDSGKNEDKRTIDVIDDHISDRNFLETVKKYISL
jgi:membrane associated rhomboid family serine protease